MGPFRPLSSAASRPGHRTASAILAPPAPGPTPGAAYKAPSQHAYLQASAHFRAGAGAHHPHFCYQPQTGW
eukprot:4615046-Alexandrium_andersonii.AAC.1